MLGDLKVFSVFGSFGPHWITRGVCVVQKKMKHPKASGPEGSKGNANPVLFYSGLIPFLEPLEAGVGAVRDPVSAPL